MQKQGQRGVTLQRYALDLNYARKEIKIFKNIEKWTLKRVKNYIPHLECANI